MGLCATLLQRFWCPSSSCKKNTPLCYRHFCVHRACKKQKPPLCLHYANACVHRNRTQRDRSRYDALSWGCLEEQKHQAQVPVLQTAAPGKHNRNGSAHGETRIPIKDSSDERCRLRNDVMRPQRHNTMKERFVASAAHEHRLSSSMPGSDHLASATVAATVSTNQLAWIAE